MCFTVYIVYSLRYTQTFDSDEEQEVEREDKEEKLGKERGREAKREKWRPSAWRVGEILWCSESLEYSHQQDKHEL